MGDASDILRALSRVAGLDARRRRATYRRAVAHGVANAQCGAERERHYGALRPPKPATASTMVPDQIGGALVDLLTSCLVSVEVGSAA
jgi:hypothetical protein